MSTNRLGHLTFILLVVLMTSCKPGIRIQGNEANSIQAVRIDVPGPTFEKVECWFEIPEGASVNCGYVNMPEDRSLPMVNKNILRLAVAVFHSTSETPAPDPVVYQVGGPGGHMLAIVPDIYERLITAYLPARDLILFDPRGTGYSEPALECNPGEDPGVCVRRLFAEGHNLYMYNSSSMAEDLQAIRVALGYDQWNLIGESYGSHVAQVTMAEQPDGLRSVILDAVLPIQLPALPVGKSEFELSLGRLVQRCMSDKECSQAYPDLPYELGVAVEKLDHQPITLSYDMDGKTLTASLSGESLMEQLMTALYEAEMIPYVPYAIHAAANGSDYEFWDYTYRWTINIDRILSSGAAWAILCGDRRIHECDHWPAAIVQEPTMSSIPTLILNGEFDPVTPPEYGHAVARWLTNHYVVDFPGFGHWANGTGHACQSQIIQSFLDDPARQPDISCIEDMQKIEFYLGNEGLSDE